MADVSTDGRAPRDSMKGTNVMQVNETQQTRVPAPGEFVVDSLLGDHQPAARFFVGSSTGVVTMVSDETAEHHHMGD